MEYINHLAIIFCLYGALALSLNLLVGYTGLVSLTHAGLFGIGAYASALLTKTYGMNFFLAAFLSVLICASIAFAIGLVLSKFRDDFYVLGAVGFNIIAVAVMLNWQSLTGGPLGVSAIPKPTLFGINFWDSFNFLILCVLFLALTYGLSQFLVKSSFGRILKAIREKELTTQIFGYKTLYYKLTIFVIGACIASVAGSLFASYITYIDPSSFVLNESIFVLSIIILGGLANLKGTLAGTLFLVLLPEILRFAGFTPDIAAQMRVLIYGALLIILMMYRPQGLIGEYKL